MELIFKKCNKCGNLIWSFNDKDIICCNENMRNVKGNEIDASFEKHVPTYEINNEKITIKVNHVMEENHYIMWIMMVSENELYYKEFKPGDNPVVTFEYKENATLYSYCNLHSLWTNKVEK